MQGRQVQGHGHKNSTPLEWTGSSFVGDGAKPFKFASDGADAGHLVEVKRYYVLSRSVPTSKSEWNSKIRNCDDPFTNDWCKNQKTKFGDSF